ncbi:MAG TPA: endonuclease domain-containing protein [Novosphingobium sp.]|nr:endonuclease domain-containing protein [Novosphingobium sp.]HPZ46936.1 endonuclease domain-containing protein [Novosphingobium sp.]HQD98998.1 endonuclease domain-containing protein [Novosphingobium sp.]
MDDNWFRANDKGYSRPTARSRELRRNATEAERKLWPHLSARRLRGVRFNRQFPIGQYICDFVSRETKLVIELDGGQHAFSTDYDERRSRFLEERGYKVLRFWNNEVLDNLDGVLTVIGQVLDNRPSPNPSRRREGSLSARPLRGEEV